MKLCLLAAAGLFACQTPRARTLTAKDLAALHLSGDGLEARPGDTVMESSRIVAVIRQPGRDAGVVSYGGALVDLADKVDGVDRLGPSQPLLALGRTVNFDKVRVVQGSGDQTIVEATGTDVLWDYFNLQGMFPQLLVYGPGSLLRFDPAQALGVSVTARYSLGKDDDFVHVTYAVTNNGTQDAALPIGLVFDTGGRVEYFAAGVGFGENGSDISQFLAPQPAHEFYAYVGSDVAYGFRPLMDDVEAGVAATQSAQMAIYGVGVTLYGVSSVTDALSATPLIVPARATHSFSFELQFGKSLNDVRRRFLERDRHPKGSVTGSVQGLSALELAGDTRVVYVAANGVVDSATHLAKDGSFTATLPPGIYSASILVAGRQPLSSAPFTVADAAVVSTSITAERGGAVTVAATFFDSLSSAEPTAARACRVTVFGQQPMTALFRSQDMREFAADQPQGTVLRDCQALAQGALALPVGTYLVQVTAGPQYDASENLVTVQAGQTVALTPQLHRVVDLAGYINADFHQHASGSPDSITDMRQRVIADAADGLDFFVGSDHDAVSDYSALVSELRLPLVTAPGVETSTFDYGHFNAWPLAPLAVPSHGAIDWAHGDNGASLTPAQIWNTQRARGAAIAQANHPRAISQSNNAEQTFDRAGLVVDVANHMLHTDPSLQPAPNALLRLPSGSLFSETFDTLEVMNGFSFGDEDGSGRLTDLKVNEVLRDWFGFLATGFTPTIVGVSDSHTIFAELSGYPRTYVAMGGATLDAAHVAAALLEHHALVSSGLFFTAQAEGGGVTGHIGDLVPTDGAGAFSVLVHIEAPQAYAFDRVEIFVNPLARSPTTFDSQNHRVVDALVPTVARDVTPTVLVRPNGGKVLLADVDVPLTVDVDAVVVVRVTGSEPLYPFLSMRGQSTAVINPAPHDASDFFTSRSGPTALAISNPIFIDRNANGRYDAPESAH